MTKIEKAAEQAEKILKDSGAGYILTCQTEDDCTLIAMNCTPNEILNSLWNILEELKAKAVKDGIPAICVAKAVLDIADRTFCNIVESKESN